MSQGQLFVPKYLDTYARDAWENAEAKGWHEEQISVGEDLALVHSEVSEALESYRTDGFAKSGGRSIVVGESECTPVNALTKPEGLMSELADVIIRVGHIAEKYRRAGLVTQTIEEAVQEKMAYNATRPHRHGGKKL